MSKFIFSNSKDISISIKNSTKNGFESSGDVSVSPNVVFQSFYKLNQRNCNFLTVGEDFVSVIGTVLYKKESGASSLQHIYNDFAGEPDVIRREVVGNGCFIIKKNKKVYVFGDDYAQFDLYYYQNNSEFIVSNNLFDVALTCNNTAWGRVNLTNVKELSIYRMVYDYETIFDTIHRVTDRQILIYDIEADFFSIQTCYTTAYERIDLCYSEIVKKVASAMISNAALCQEHFGTPMISQTGGLDNRLVLASFLAAGCKPDICYGVGNTIMTGTRNEDLEIDKIYRDRFGLKLDILSWRNKEPIDEEWYDLAMKYGFYSLLYGGSQDFFRDYTKGIKNKMVCYGYMGEMYRNLDFIESLKTDTFNIEDYIDAYVITGLYNKYSKIIDVGELKKRMIKHYEKICEENHLNPRKVHKRDEYIFSMERRHIADTISLNWTNYDHFCLYHNGQRNVLQYVLSISPEDKAQKKFMLDVLKEMYPPILEVPFFSHNRIQIYDAKRGILRYTTKDALVMKALKFRKYIPRFIKTFINNKILITNKQKIDGSSNSSNCISIMNSIMERHGYIEGKDYVSNINGTLVETSFYFSHVLYVIEVLASIKDAKL